MTNRNSEKTSGRAAALVNQALDVLRRADQAPRSPVRAFLRAAERREFRRSVKRLRTGKAQPLNPNIPAGELADIYERAVRRDEILEQSAREFERITVQLGDVLAEKDPEERKTLDAAIDEIERAAKENGPASEAAARYRHLQILAWIGRQTHFHKRRQRAPAPPPVPSPRPAVAAPKEPVVIPLAGSDLSIRIGTGADPSWIGSPPRGDQRISTFLCMPDGNHLIACAAGAAYIINAASRTLVEEIGTDIVNIDMAIASRDPALTLFFVYHEDGTIEALGKSGRLWRTEPIGTGAFRNAAFENGVLSGEARDASGEGWVRFAVEVATGGVRVG
jgi:hypothetical protein